MFGLFSSRCQVCGSPFKRKRYRWTIRDKKAWVCPRCNSELEKRASAAAFGREVNWPEIREESGCGGLGCLIIIGLIGFSIFGSFSNRSGSRPASASPVNTNGNQAVQPSSPERDNRYVSKIQIFNFPEKAARLPLSLGLTDTAPDQGTWRRGGDSDWYALSKMVIAQENPAQSAPLNNEITCLHRSTYSSYVEQVKWTANVFNEAEATIIMPQFKQLCLDYCRQMGCLVPPELFINVDPSKGQKLETADAKFGLEKLAYKTGYGWELIVEAK